ncbi:DUF5927 domain-containing protein [Oceanibium sediminis]|uniref:DUF5927 domain-containing protein n=1 Tax=Oceanibium sediminis TaxID=2026339 RepID=UPI00130046F9|nr:beta-1,6-N-acetylglucosaminyltransferase [Oceanibium sediminis]
MIGVVLLAHEQLWRTAQLAKHLTRQGCRVVVHIDARVGDEELDKLHSAMGGSDNLAFAPRHRCDWGTFSLVEASLGALRLLFERWPDVSHVVQLSGSCLPIKPIAALEAHLAAHQGVDFIESVDVETDPWVIDGLSIERFTLYHPLPWRRFRRSFDALVAIQRRLGIKRKMPAGLHPRIGSQWWALSAETLRAILADPNLPEYCTFFRRTWIPDESFFQTLAAKHSTKSTSTPLTFVRFDPQGKPYVFYDDHLDLLLHAEGFFARKIWRGANQLYRVFLNPRLTDLLPSKSDGGRLTARFERAQTRHINGRKGLISQGRHPGRRMTHQHETACPYLVIDGLQVLYPDHAKRVNQNDRTIAHGQLFHPERVDFVDNAANFTGNLSASTAIRDHKPVHFLSKLIWVERRRAQCFLHDFGHDVPIDGFLLRDPNAHILRLQDAWIHDLYATWADDPASLAQAVSARLAKEAATRARIEAALDGAHLHVVRTRTLLSEGTAALQQVVETLPEKIQPCADFSGLHLPERFAEYLEALASTDAPEDEVQPLIGDVARYEEMTRVLRRKT